jgi:hypothetical protein
MHVPLSRLPTASRAVEPAGCTLTKATSPASIHIKTEWREVFEGTTEVIHDVLSIFEPVKEE